MEIAKGRLVVGRVAVWISLSSLACASLQAAGAARAQAPYTLPHPALANVGAKAPRTWTLRSFRVDFTPGQANLSDAARVQVVEAAKFISDFGPPATPVRVEAYAQ